MDLVEAETEAVVVVAGEETIIVVVVEEEEDSEAVETAVVVGVETKIMEEIRIMEEVEVVEEEDIKGIVEDIIKVEIIMVEIVEEDGDEVVVDKDINKTIEEEDEAVGDVVAVEEDTEIMVQSKPASV